MARRRKLGQSVQLQQRTPVRRCALGAGGNRTRVRWTVTVRDTTIPELLASRLPAHRVGWTSRSSARSFPNVSLLSGGQRSLPAVLHRFCCRACGGQAPGAV